MTLETPPEKEGDKSLQKIGKYKILGTLGRGSMGVVYKGQDPEIGRIVAVKTLRKIISTQFHNTDQALERFKLEARSAGNLRHPNIITLFDVNVDGDIPYIVMDYVQGESLDQVIARNSQLTPGTTLHYLKQLAAGLDYAHEKGVIHRDIKPSNIIVDTNETVYILDFGIARINDSFSEDDKLVKSEPVMGTPGYMSPEQILNKDLDYKTDLFSFAVVAYECLCGKRPFPGKNFNEVLGNILNSKPVPATSLVALPPEVNQAFDVLLSKKKEERPENAIRVVEVLARALGMDRIEKPVLASASQEDRFSSSGRPGNWKSLGKDAPNSGPQNVSSHLDNLSKTPNVPLGDDDDYSSDSSGQQAATYNNAHVGGYGAPSGDLFAHVDDAIGSSLEMSRQDKSANITKLLVAGITVACLVAVGGLFLNKSRQNSLPPATETQIDISLPERGISLDTEGLPEAIEQIPVQQLTLPDTAPVPSGKLVTEMTDKEVLGVLVGSDSNEALLFQALKEAERRKLPELVEASAIPIKNDSYAVRLETVKLLGRLEDARAVPLLVTCLDDHDPVVRGNAARALAALGSRKSLAYLRASLGKESNSSVRHEVKNAIEKITGFPIE